MIRIVLAAVAMTLLALPAARADTGVALVIANDVYDNAPRVANSSRVAPAVEVLERAGFIVTGGQDLSAAEMRTDFANFLETGATIDGGRLVIVLAGHFAYSARDVWLLGVDADAPGLAQADVEGLRLGAVLETAATAPGGALVLLVPALRGSPLGAPLQPGLAEVLEVPQGVTVVRGPGDQILSLVRGLPDGTATLPELVRQGRQLRAEGYLSDLAPFLPTPTEAPVEDVGATAERALWDAALADGGLDGFQTYLELFPDGRYADQARAEIARITDTPERREEALGLTRDQRRAIQRQLTLLGHDTRGVDGIFGPGTRRAITAWQTGNDLPATGFLDADQLALLDEDAARRQAQIDEEERERQRAEEAADREFWRDTGEGSDEAGLRAYLGRYPDGLFSDVAEARLAAIEAEKDRNAWALARAADTAEGYRRYLEAFPDGAFADTARDRLAALDPPPATPPGQVEEDALNLGLIARTLIERQLDAMGFEPGRVDGRFDESTRRAIRAYQRSRGLPETGYVSQDMLRRLVMDGMQSL